MCPHSTSTEYSAPGGASSPSSRWRSEQENTLGCATPDDRKVPHMKLVTSLRPLRFVTALALPLFAGCDPTPAPNTPDGFAPNGPLYAFTTQIISSDEAHSYILLTDKLDHTESLPLDK